MARPDLNIMAVGGDGDFFSIGAGHLIHAALRNIDITVVVMDNETYGLTKGQTSPTSPTGHTTKSTPYGLLASQFNPIATALVSERQFCCTGIFFQTERTGCTDRARYQASWLFVYPCT